MKMIVLVAAAGFALSVGSATAAPISYPAGIANGDSDILEVKAKKDQSMKRSTKSKSDVKGMKGMKGMDHSKMKM